VPTEGTRFVAILTIEDPEGDRPVFNDVRASLLQTGVTLQDIRQAARVRPRNR
jgi:hypothetical protein